MKTLLHICCAPCANQPIEVLRTDGIEVTGFWYNPNIHPVTEYRARRNCLEEYAKTIDLPILMKNDYALRPFVRMVAEDIGHRCGKCYEMRLFETARQAAEGGFDSFTSSLFISPYQQHELMREVAERAASEYGVQFLYRDFRPYFKDGQNFAREHGFYMQKYCGCVFSEEERYIKPKKLNTLCRTREVNVEALGSAVYSLRKMLEVLGVMIPVLTLSEEDRTLYQAWMDAKAQKDFAKADEVRAQLMERGIL